MSVAEHTAEIDTRLKVGGPDAVTLTVCHSCMRTDRWNKLTERHYAGGTLCPGPVERVTYARVTPPAMPEGGRDDG